MLCCFMENNVFFDLSLYRYSSGFVISVLFRPDAFCRMLPRGGDRCRLQWDSVYQTIVNPLSGPLPILSLARPVPQLTIVRFQRPPPDVDGYSSCRNVVATCFDACSITLRTRQRSRKEDKSMCCLHVTPHAPISAACQIFSLLLYRVDQ